MKRREAVKISLRLIGTSLTAPLVVEALRACKPQANDGWTPAVLSQQEDELVKEIGDLIIPATETPGASDVGVNRFIDLLLQDVLPEEEKVEFIQGLKSFEKQSEAANGLPFLKSSPDQKRAFVQKLDASALDDGNQGPSFFRTIKMLSLVAYFSSEEGMKQNFNYVPIPGSYDGCRSLGPDEKMTIGDHI